MPSFQVTTVQATGGTYALTVQRVSDGFYWQPASSSWNAAPLFSQKQIPFAEGVNENAGSYVAQVDDLGSPGHVRIRIHDTGAVGNPTVDVVSGYVVSGLMAGIDDFVTTRATPADVATQTMNVLGTTYTLPELTERPPASPTIRQALMLLYMTLRNRTSSTPERLSIHNDAGEVVMVAPLSQTETGFTRERLNNG
jgi:hypothetical protein